MSGIPSFARVLGALRVVPCMHPQYYDGPHNERAAAKATTSGAGTKDRMRGRSSFGLGISSDIDGGFVGADGGRRMGVENRGGGDLSFDHCITLSLRSCMLPQDRHLAWTVRPVIPSMFVPKGMEVQYSDSEISGEGSKTLREHLGIQSPPPPSAVVAHLYQLASPSPDAANTAKHDESGDEGLTGASGVVVSYRLARYNATAGEVFNDIYEYLSRHWHKDLGALVASVDGVDDDATDRGIDGIGTLSKAYCARICKLACVPVRSDGNRLARPSRMYFRMDAAVDTLASSSSTTGMSSSTSSIYTSSTPPPVTRGAAPASVASDSQSLVLSPFMFEVPRWLGAHEQLLKEMGARERPRPADYVALLREMCTEGTVMMRSSQSSEGRASSCHDARMVRSMPLNPNELEAALRVIALLDRYLQSNPSALKSLFLTDKPSEMERGVAVRDHHHPRGEHRHSYQSLASSLPVPDAHGRLVPANHCVFVDGAGRKHLHRLRKCDNNEREGQDGRPLVRFVNCRLSVSTCRRLGVRSLSNAIQERLVSATDQREDTGIPGDDGKATTGFTMRPKNATGGDGEKLRLDLDSEVFVSALAAMGVERLTLRRQRNADCFDWNESDLFDDEDDEDQCEFGFDYDGDGRYKKRGEIVDHRGGDDGIRFTRRSQRLQRQLEVFFRRALRRGEGTSVIIVPRIQTALFMQNHRENELLSAATSKRKQDVSTRKATVHFDVVIEGSARADQLFFVDRCGGEGLQGKSGTEGGSRILISSQALRRSGGAVRLPQCIALALQQIFCTPLGGESGYVSGRGNDSETYVGRKGIYAWALSEVMSEVTAVTSVIAALLHSSTAIPKTLSTNNGDGGHDAAHSGQSVAGTTSGNAALAIRAVLNQFGVGNDISVSGSSPAAVAVSGGRAERRRGRPGRRLTRADALEARLRPLHDFFPGEIIAFPRRRVTDTIPCHGKGWTQETAPRASLGRRLYYGRVVAVRNDAFGALRLIDVDTGPVFGHQKHYGMGIDLGSAREQDSERTQSRRGGDTVDRESSRVSATSSVRSFRSSDIMCFRSCAEAAAAAISVEKRKVKETATKVSHVATTGEGGVENDDQGRKDRVAKDTDTSTKVKKGGDTEKGKRKIHGTLLPAFLSSIMKEATAVMNAAASSPIKSPDSKRRSDAKVMLAHIAGTAQAEASASARTDSDQLVTAVRYVRLSFIFMAVIDLFRRSNKNATDKDTTQHNKTQHNAKQHNTTQNNTTRHNCSAETETCLPLQASLLMLTPHH